MDSGWARRPGLALIGRDTPEQVTAWARAAESAGLGSFWVIEDYFQPGAFTLAAGAAAVTERLVVGIGVVNPYTRHPALLAMETAALAGLARGRAVLGLGSSNRRWIEEQMGLPFTAPLGAVRDTVDVLRRLLAGERVTHEGPSFTLRDVQLAFVPPAPVPVFLGVKGPRALAMAGEIADGLHGSILSTPAHLRRVRATAEAARRAAGRTASLPVIAYVPVAIEDDGRAAREAVRPFLARYLGFLHGQSILADAGVAPALSLAIRERVLRGEPAGHLVGDGLVDTLAIAGTAAECREALARWAEAGLDAPIAVPMPGPDAAARIARIGEILVPAWRALVAHRPPLAERS